MSPRYHRAVLPDLLVGRRHDGEHSHGGQLVSVLHRRCTRRRELDDHALAMAGLERRDDRHRGAVNLRQSPTASAVSVAVRDPAVGGGLGDLSSGASDKAAVVFTMSSPCSLQGEQLTGAAAGGYVSIGTETSGEPTALGLLVRQSAAVVPQLSDGAILWGARRLRTAREQSDVDEARSALLEGYERGLPLYTLGLTWLIDGLSAFRRTHRVSPRSSRGGSFAGELTCGNRLLCCDWERADDRTHHAAGQGRRLPALVRWLRQDAAVLIDAC